MDNNGFCSDKTITATGASAFANVTGICPEAPTQFGGYKMAGAALYAHTKPVRNDYAIPTANKRAFKIDTYSVALATGTPRIKIPVPRQPGKFIFISPSYRLDLGAGGQGGGTLVDFKVISQNATSGSYLINWEDSEQGGDFDQDVLGLLSYSVNTTTSVISVTTYAAAQATANGQGFGYSISGTSGKDGVHFHSGILGFNYTDSRNIAVTPTTNVNASGGCNDCQVAQTASTGTYTMVGVTADSLKDPLWYAAKYGGFNTDITATYSLGAPLPLAAWDSKGTDGSVGADGIPDNYFLAVDPAQLEASLSSIFSTILKSGGAAPAATSAQTQAGGYAYQSTFSVKPSSTSPAADADASGQFLRFSILSSGLASTVPDFDAGARVTIQNWNTGRNILSLSSAGQIPFRWASLDSVQKLVLRVNPKTGASSAITVGQNRLEWLRGNSTQETTAGGLRKRPTTKLGAIINSTPWFVGPPSAGYTNSAYGGGYNTFRTTNTATNAVFVAANDGMLHAFNGATGDELFAYVPRAMYTTATTAPFAKLSGITDKDFALNVGTAGMTVDGSVMAADMKVGGSWSTYLFGTFGRGAKGVYALDVTRPQNVTEASTSVVKWEFSEATGDPDMGYIVGRATPRSNGQPFQTGYMANGKWAAIYGNGYNSTSGKAALFILFADGPGSASATAWTTGTHYIKIPVGAAGLDNGLATPTAVDSNNDGVIDYIYAGDLKGQVWKFDVRNTNPAMWASATGSVPLYQAQTTLTGTSTVVVQPITTVVQPYPHPKGGYQLLFATGKSLENTDFPSAVPYVNRIYGIYDKPGTTTTLTVGLTDLVAKTATVIASVPYLVTATVDYTTQKGWYINLPQGSESALFNQIAFDSNLAALRTLFTNGVSDGCRIDTSSADWTFNPVSGIPPDNLIPGAPTVNGYKAAGSITANSYEVGRGGVYRKATPPPSTTVCTAGDPNCVCNPAAATQCVLCLDAATCNPPWAPLEANQCVFRTFGAGGDGNPDTTLRYGKCTDGRLTWREIFRNR